MAFHSAGERGQSWHRSIDRAGGSWRARGSRAHGLALGAPKGEGRSALLEGTALGALPEGEGTSTLRFVPPPTGGRHRGARRRRPCRCRPPPLQGRGAGSARFFCLLFVVGALFDTARFRGN